MKNVFLILTHAMVVMAFFGVGIYFDKAILGMLGGLVVSYFMMLKY